jgi:hypothetical protein
MTAIAVLKVHGWPLVIGDTVISGPLTPGAQARLPTIGGTQVIFPDETGWGITGTLQKVVICTEHLVVAWANSPLAAAELIGELREVTTPSREAIRECFEKLSQPSKATESLATGGYYFDAAKHEFVFFSSHGRDVDFQPSALFDGSGATFLKEAIQTVLRQPVATSNNEQSTPPTDAVQLAANVIGHLMSQECLTQESLLNFFGGCYEIITFIGGRFQKFDRITYLFELAETDGNTVTFSPKSVLRPCYVGDLLFVRVANFDGWEEIQVVQPPGSRVPARDLAREVYNVGDFDTDWTCTITLVKFDGQLWYPKRGPRSSR